MVETSRLFIICVPAGDCGASQLVQSVQVTRAEPNVCSNVIYICGGNFGFSSSLPFIIQSKHAGSNRACDCVFVTAGDGALGSWECRVCVSVCGNDCLLDCCVLQYRALPVEAIESCCCLLS